MWCIIGGDMKKTLIIATTVYHIIVAIQMRRTVLKSHDLDLIIGDETPNIERLVRPLQKTKLFNEIYFVKMNDYNKAKGRYEQYTKLDYCLKKHIDIQRMFRVEKKYDIFLVPYFHPFYLNLYSFIRTFVNKKIHVYLYEEGLAIYSNIGIILDNYKKDCENVSIYRRTHYGVMLNEIRGIITFNPQLYQWGKQYKKIQIPYLNREDKKLLNILNDVFEYHGEYESQYKKKVIFFEEAKYADGISVNDISVVNRIADVVGKENVLVKLHPRMIKNRFQPLGYETNSDNLIPWELLYMNHDFENTLLVSVASSSIVHPMILFKDNLHALFLFKMVHSFLPVDLQMHQKFIEEVIVKQNLSCFYLPKDNTELKQMIEGFLEKCED